MDNDNIHEGFTPNSKLNFVIGICAMLISIASFYATYLQANSAAQQVKAMTYPLIQHFTNNYDINNREQAISLVLNNSGVGPAIIRKVEYFYNDKKYDDVYQFMRACCDKEYQAFKDQQGAASSVAAAQIVTAKDENIILPANDFTQTLYLLKHESNNELWQKLNIERRKLRVSICYCSLLENCYLSQGVGTIKEVKSCS